MQKSFISQLKNKLSVMDEVVFGYLFGSYARNVAGINSDVDLVVLNNVKNIYLLENILNDGLVLKDDDKRFDFEVRSHHDVLDYKAFRRYIDAA